MTAHRLNIAVVPGSFAVCRLSPSDPVPPWARAGPFWSITGTEEELSIVCEETRAPPEIRAERGFALLRVAGPLDLSLIGIFASIAAPLAAAGISIVPLATYDTDYLLVRHEALAAAAAALRRAGHTVAGGSPLR